MTTTIKTAKNGTRIYYVDGKRVSRDKAIETQANVRGANLFIVEYESSIKACFVNGENKIYRSTRQGIVCKLETDIDEYHGFTVRAKLNGESWFTVLRKFYSKVDAKALVAQIEDSYFAGEQGVRIHGDGTVEPLRQE